MLYGGDGQEYGLWWLTMWLIMVNDGSGQVWLTIVSNMVNDV